LCIACETRADMGRLRGSSLSKLPGCKNSDSLSLSVLIYYFCFFTMLTLSQRPNDLPENERLDRACAEMTLIPCTKPIPCGQPKLWPAHPGNFEAKQAVQQPLFGSTNRGDAAAARRPLSESSSLRLLGGANIMRQPKFSQRC
jgi:hypothetical protein